MSIFKETIADTIQTQLKARTLVVSGENNQKSQNLPFYLSKNAWVRMTSFTNFTSGKELVPDGKGALKIKPDGHYQNDQLSRKYVLEGGTLYTQKNGGELGTLRYNIATPGAAYGGDIDLRADGTADPAYFRTFGIRPMPGIIDVGLRTLGAYGSLFETTVKFYAWDINQLNELETLFMRPGYSVLLEWGWSQYIDYDDKNVALKDKLKKENIYPTVFNSRGINPFDSTLTQQAVYDKLEVLRTRYRHNYDGMLGYVKNFNWTMMPNGGFECSTTLISMGEAINTIKMSSNVNKTTNSFTNLDATAPSNYVFDDYENILLSLKSEVEGTSFVSLKPEEGVTLPANNEEGIKVLDEDEYRGAWDYDRNYIAKSIIIEKVKDYYPTQATYLENQPKVQYLKIGAQETQGKDLEYISVDVWLAIVASYYQVITKNNNSNPTPLVKIQVPGEDDLCLACKDTISIDPKICQVKNEGAFKNEMAFITYYGDYDPRTSGINPPMYNADKSEISNSSWQFYDATKKAGKIANILVNINLLLSTYKEMKNASNEEGVTMLDYIKNVLNKISNALGGLNNFSLSTVSKSQNVMQVVDLFYLESGAASLPENKYQFDLMGLGSICRSVSIQSQIFENQSTIVAIAAQSRANLANVYNSSQVYLNAGLEDRLALAKGQGNELEDDYPKGNASDVFYQKLYNLMLYARDYLVGTYDDGSSSYLINLDETGQANPATILKQSMLRYNSELNFKALIPFKLKITIDGIGGIVVGQIFTVKQNVLPKNYYDKKLGFVITGISHKLEKNDWITELDTQICILDQDRADFQKFIDIDREGFGEYIKKVQVRALLYPILMDFLEYQASRSLIGFVYAAADISSNDSENFNEILYDYVLNDFNDDNYVTDYWKSNIDLFLFGTGTTSDFTLDKFGDFVRTWARIYKANNPANANFKIINDKTLGDLLDFLAQTNYATVDPDYKNIETEIQSMQFTLNNSLDVFYPNPDKVSPISIYTGNDNKRDVAGVLSEKLEFSLTGVGGVNFNHPYGYLEVYGFDRKILRDRLNRFINSSSLSNIANFYSQKVNIQGYKNTSLSDLVKPSSNAMYGLPNSIGHSYSVNEVNGPFALVSSKPEISNAVQYPNALEIDQKFASTIEWTGTFNGGRTIKTVRSKDKIISSTTNVYIQTYS